MNPWYYENPYAYHRGISPPRDATETGRPGYYPHDYRSVSPMSIAGRPSMGRRSSSIPQMYANLAGADGSDMPGGDWYDQEEEMPMWRRPRGDPYRDSDSERGGFR